LDLNFLDDLLLHVTSTLQFLCKHYFWQFNGDGHLEVQETLMFNVQVAGVASEVLPELAEADMLIWFGDFNYRLDDISYDEARNYIACKHFDTLLRKDQLRGEMKVGHVFQGMREANIKFPPTYKFDRGQVGLQGLCLFIFLLFLLKRFSRPFHSVALYPLLTDLNFCWMMCKNQQD
jgi:hypothetical protein